MTNYGHIVNVFINGYSMREALHQVMSQQPEIPESLEELAKRRLPIPDAARLLGCSEYTVRNLLSQKKLTRIKIWGKVFTDRNEVEAVLNGAFKGTNEK